MIDDDSDARAEQAFREAFAAHTGDPLPDLAVGRRRPARWPWFTVAAAAVVLVLVLVVVRPGAMSAILVATGPTAGSPTPSAGATTTIPADPTKPVAWSALPAPEPGWRWVSARDVAAQVPATWADHRVADWCAADVPTTPFIDTWTGFGEDPLGCGRALPQFVRFLPYTDSVRISTDGVGTYASSGLGAVTVVVWTPADADKALAEKVVRSMRLISDDVLGCRVRTAAISSEANAGPTPSTDLATLGIVDSVVMCRHIKDTRSSTLIASSVISGQKMVDLVAALRAAPAEGARCPLYYLGTDVRVLRLHTSAGVSEVFVYPNGCNENYLTAGTSRRELTYEVCQALDVTATLNGGCTKS